MQNGLDMHTQILIVVPSPLWYTPYVRPHLVWLAQASRPHCEIELAQSQRRSAVEYIF